MKRARALVEVGGRGVRAGDEEEKEEGCFAFHSTAPQPGAPRSCRSGSSVCSVLLGREGVCVSVRAPQSPGDPRVYALMRAFLCGRDGEIDVLTQH